MKNNILLKQAFWLYVARFSSVALQSIVFFIFAASIGLEEFGVFSFIFSASQVFSVLLGFGIAPYLLRELVYRESLKKKKGSSNYILICYLRIIKVAIILLFLWALLFCYIDLYELRSIKNEIITVLILGYLLATLEIIVSVMRVNKKTSFSMLLRDLFPYLFLIIGFILYPSKGSVTAEFLLLIYASSLLITCLLGFFFVVPYLLENYDKKQKNTLSIIEPATFWGSGIIGIMSNQSDILIARVLLDDMSLGLYALLRRVSNLISLPQSIANWSIYNSVAKGFAKEDRELLTKSAEHGLFIAVPVALMLFITTYLSSPIWLMYFKVDVDIFIYIALLVLLLGQLFNVFSGANFVFASQCKEEAFVLKCRIYSGLFGAILIFSLGWKFGVVGVAVGYSLSVILLNYPVTIHVKNKIGVDTFIKTSSIKNILKNMYGNNLR